GNTGSVIAEALLAKGEKVRVIGRSADKLQRFVEKGGEAFVGDVSDAAAMTRVFSSATSVYAMIPPNFTSADPRADQAKTAEALGSALERAGVARAVILSSIGADLAEGAGPVSGLHSFEERIKKVSKLNALILRPGLFMENLLAYIGLIKTMGMTAGTLKGDLPIAMIATRDIGERAAEALVGGEFTGITTLELLGPRDVSMNEAAKILGQAIGKPGLSYSRMPGMIVKGAMTQMGFSSQSADALLEMDEAINDGRMRPLEQRSARTETPTTLETFAAEVFAPAFQGRAARA
ncbi:MAG: NAD(P)H-binding protein, partial [Verrucomicrobiales bacterium]|nr:NAD(P)H-binding protein [Verrucomicrobiales bacterium]